MLSKERFTKGSNLCKLSKWFNTAAVLRCSVARVEFLLMLNLMMLRI